MTSSSGRRIKTIGPKPRIVSDQYRSMARAADTVSFSAAGGTCSRNRSSRARNSRPPVVGATEFSKTRLIGNCAEPYKGILGTSSLKRWTVSVASLSSAARWQTSLTACKVCGSSAVGSMALASGGRSSSRIVSSTYASISSPTTLGLVTVSFTVESVLSKKQ